MPKLTRITNKIFGQNATAIGDNPQIGQFGSAKAGTYIGTTDVETIQELSAWSNGWVDAVTPQNQFPALPEMTAVHKVLSRQTAYLYQEGIPEYDIDTTYFKGSLVKSYSDNDGIKLYFSKIDENINHSLEDTTAWEEASLGGSSGLEIGDIGTALYVDESKGKRRKLNGSILAINENTQDFVDWLKSVQATNPEYFTTESNWQTESALAIDGCVYKYVLDEDNATVRLPKYPEYVEINASNTTVPVKGNGMTLGMTNGTTNAGACQVSTNNIGMVIRTEPYGKNVGQTALDGNVTANTSIGITTDSSKSGIIADTSNVLKQTKLKLYYFIQIATGAETEVNIINEIELNNPYTLFDSKYSDHQLFNASWLRSQGQYNPKAIYVKAYEALQVEYNSQVAVGSTVELPSGTQYTKQGLSVKLSTETYNDYDFVLNTSDETFRLPIKTKLASSNSVKWSSKINKNLETTYTADTSGYVIYTGKATGATSGTAFIYINGVEIAKDTHNADNDEAHFYIPISKGDTYRITDSAGSLYYFFVPLNDDLNNLYLYYYVGETVQNANLIDAGRLAETKVSKSGDTMTGNLKIDKDKSSVILKDNTIDYTDTSTTPTDSGAFEWRDKNGIWVGYAKLSHKATNIQTLDLYVRRNIDGTIYANLFSMGVDGTGKLYYNRPQIISSYVNGTSGYNIWSNGYCEQWGFVSSANNTNITLPKKYNSVNYNLQATCSGTGYNAEIGWGWITSQNIIVITSSANAGSTRGLPVSWKTTGYLAEGEY